MLRLSSSNVFFAEFEHQAKSKRGHDDEDVGDQPDRRVDLAWGAYFSASSPEEADKRGPGHANESEEGDWKLGQVRRLPASPIRALQGDRKP